MSNKVSIALLCEDYHHAQFVNQFLAKKKHFARRIFPDGYRRRETGGAKPNNDFVVRRAAREVKVVRKSHVKSALILVVDGDERGLPSRLGEIANEIKSAKMDALGGNELIAVLVPCRNIETWIHHFAGNEANETEDFAPRYAKNYDAIAEADTFADWVSDGNAEAVAQLPALNEAREELRRLYALMK